MMALCEGYRAPSMVRLLRRPYRFPFTREQLEADLRQFEAQEGVRLLDALRSEILPDLETVRQEVAP
jgi:hypothetical protein